MWCERVIRNAAGEDFGGRAVDYVEIRWDECRPVLKARSRGGEEVRVLLGRSERVAHGDVLFEDERRVMLVHVLPCELVVVRSDQPRLLAELALELGNLHWPTQATDSELVFPEDEAALASVRRMGLTFSREERRFDPLRVRATGVKVSEGVRILRPGQDQIEDARRRKVASSV